MSTWKVLGQFNLGLAKMLLALDMDLNEGKLDMNLQLVVPLELLFWLCLWFCFRFCSHRYLYPCYLFSSCYLWNLIPPLLGGQRVMVQPCWRLCALLLCSPLPLLYSLPMNINNCKNITSRNRNFCGLRNWTWNSLNIQRSDLLCGMMNFSYRLISVVFSCPGSLLP